MAVRRVGFQAAVDHLKGLANVGPPLPQSLPPSNPSPVVAEASASESPPFKVTYKNLFKPHAWLETRGVTAEVLARYASR